MKKSRKSQKSRKPRLYEGLPVVDATDDIALHISPADIKVAKKKDPGMCAAAMAGKRELKKDVRVFLTRTYVKEKKHWVRYVTPESASREIVAFDRGSAFEPGEYVIKAPAKSIQLGVSKGAKTPKTGAHKARPYHATGLIREWKDRR